MHFETYIQVFIGYWILKRAGFLSGLLFFDRGLRGCDWDFRGCSLVRNVSEKIQILTRILLTANCYYPFLRIVKAQIFAEEFSVADGCCGFLCS